MDAELEYEIDALKNHIGAHAWSRIEAAIRDDEKMKHEKIMANKTVKTIIEFMPAYANATMSLMLVAQAGVSMEAMERASKELKKQYECGRNEVIADFANEVWEIMFSPKGVLPVGYDREEELKCWVAAKLRKKGEQK